MLMIYIELSIKLTFRLTYLCTYFDRYEAVCFVKTSVIYSKLTVLSSRHTLYCTYADSSRHSSMDSPDDEEQ
jgi:hypothetical protein